MKATELRIGNWINIYDDYNAQVTGMANPNKAWFVKNPHDTDCAFNVHQIKPIPLTEEWLLKLKLHKEFNSDNSENRNCWYLKDCDDNFYINYDCDSYIGWYVGASCYGYIIGIKHVHQLQNLYFALTEEELTKNK